MRRAATKNLCHTDMIRLANLLVLAVFLPGLQLPVLLILLCLGLSWMLLFDRTALRLSWLRISRLRWLFAAIAVLYVGFTPGTPVFGPVSLEGLLEGSQRVLVLMTLVVAVVLVLHNYSAGQLASALLGLLRPLALLRLPVESAARRIAVTLDRVTEVEQLVKSQRRTGELMPARRLADICERLEAQAAEDLPVHPLVRAPAPIWYAWFLPLGLALILFVARTMVVL